MGYGNGHDWRNRGNCHVHQYARQLGTLACAFHIPVRAHSCRVSAAFMSPVVRLQFDQQLKEGPFDLCTHAQRVCGEHNILRRVSVERAAATLGFDGLQKLSQAHPEVSSGHHNLPRQCNLRTVARNCRVAHQSDPVHTGGNETRTNVTQMDICWGMVQRSMAMLPATRSCRLLGAITSGAAKSWFSCQRSYQFYDSEGRFIELIRQLKSQNFLRGN